MYYTVLRKIQFYPTLMNACTCQGGQDMWRGERMDHMRTGSKTFGSQNPDILQSDAERILPEEAPEKGILTRAVIDIFATILCAAGIVFFILRFLTEMEAAREDPAAYVRVAVCVFLVYFCTVMMVIRAEHLALDREVRQYRRYIRRRGAVSIEEMAQDFDADKISLRHDLELLIRKKMLRKVTIENGYVSYHR